MKNSNCKNKIFNTKQNNGITLIALILTIIVLMILAVVAISAVNDGGIIQHAQDAKNEHTIAQEKEEILLAQSEWTLAKYSSNNPSQTFKSFMESKLVDTGIATKVEGNDNGPLTVKMKSGNSYTVTESGEIIPQQSGNQGGEGGSSGESDPTISLLEQYLFGDSPNGRNYYEELSEDWEIYNKNEELGIAQEDIKGLTYGYGENELIFYIEYEGAKYKFKTNIDEDGEPANTVPSYGVVRIDNWDKNTKVGKYVEDENGDTWRIIYEDDTHGLQMISVRTFQYNSSRFRLGYEDTLITDWNALDTTTPEFKLADLNKDGKLEDSKDLERAIYSYNQAIKTLNTACENLFKENGSYTRTYIQDVRCVGSNPVFANKNSENTTTATSANYPALATLPNNNASQEAGLCDGVGYGTDNNFETDFDRMVALGINIGEASNEKEQSYWLASRVVYADSEDVSFSVRCVYSDGDYNHDDLWYVDESYACGNAYGEALRPVVSLSSSIQFAEGDGSEGNPYKFN